MERDIEDMKILLSYLLRESEWSEPEHMHLMECVKRLGLRLKDEQNFVGDSSRHPRNKKTSPHIT